MYFEDLLRMLFLYFQFKYVSVEAHRSASPSNNDKKEVLYFIINTCIENKIKED